MVVFLCGNLSTYLVNFKRFFKMYSLWIIRCVWAVVVSDFGASVVEIASVVLTISSLTKYSFNLMLSLFYFQGCLSFQRFFVTPFKNIQLQLQMLEYWYLVLVLASKTIAYPKISKQVDGCGCFLDFDSLVGVTVSDIFSATSFFLSLWWIYHCYFFDGWNCPLYSNLRLFVITLLYEYQYEIFEMGLKG